MPASRPASDWSASSKKSEEDRDARLKASQQLERQLKESEADRAARLEVIHQLESQLKENQEERTSQALLIKALKQELRPLKTLLERTLSKLEVLKSSKLVHLLLRLGLVSDSEKSSQLESETGKKEPQ